MMTVHSVIEELERLQKQVRELAAMQAAARDWILDQEEKQNQFDAYFSKIEALLKPGAFTKREAMAASNLNALIMHYGVPMTSDHLKWSVLAADDLIAELAK